MKPLPLLFFALCLWSGCADQGVNLSSVDNSTLLDGSIDGKQITAIVDARFRLELEVLADAGFQWDCSISDSSVVRLERVSFRSASPTYPPAPGGAVFETFHFQTKAEGSCTVLLIHHQAWLPTVPPRDKVRFFLYVRQ